MLEGQGRWGYSAWAMGAGNGLPGLTTQQVVAEEDGRGGQDAPGCFVKPADFLSHRFNQTNDLANDAVHVGASFWNNEFGFQRQIKGNGDGGKA